MMKKKKDGFNVLKMTLAIMLFITWFAVATPLISDALGLGLVDLV